jgi:hypothetical protein
MKILYIAHRIPYLKLKENLNLIKKFHSKG